MKEAPPTFDEMYYLDQKIVLRLIEADVTPSTSQLGIELGVSHTTISNRVNKLEAHGWMQPRPDGRDGPRKQFALAPVFPTELPLPVRFCPSCRGQLSRKGTLWSCKRCRAQHRIEKV